MYRVTRLLVATLLVAGCSAPRTNPSFTLTERQAKSELSDMAKSPRGLERPLVILGGFADVGFGTSMLRSKLLKLFADDGSRVITVNFAGCRTFDECTQRVIRAVDASFGPGSNPQETIEVDVIGQSMGGLVALYASGEPGGRRLNARRIFALSSPLQGAKLAEAVQFDTSPMHRDMRPGSDFLVRLHATPPRAEVFAYTRLHDSVVGEQFSGTTRPAWWLDSPKWGFSHLTGVMDDRVHADVARRLRGEPAYATAAAPLPR